MTRDEQRLNAAMKRAIALGERLRKAEDDLLDLCSKLGQERVEAAMGHAPRIYWSDDGRAYDDGILGDIRC